MPTVLMGSSVAGTPYDFVALDDVAAGRMAAGRLLELGHRQILVIGGRQGVSSHELRLKGCRVAFKERGLDLAEDQVALASFTTERAYEETCRRISVSSPPTAIVSLSNFMTIGVMRALAALKLACPEQVSFIGVDDLDWADIMRPRPTLIAQPIADMTRIAIAALLEQAATSSESRAANSSSRQDWSNENPARRPRKSRSLKSAMSTGGMQIEVSQLCAAGTKSFGLAVTDATARTLEPKDAASPKGDTRLRYRRHLA